MNFYKLIKQQYDYNKDALLIRCNNCPCKTLRNIVFEHKPRKRCRDEMIYLADKYNIRNFDAYLCNDCLLASLKIAKKLFGKEVNKI